MLKTLEGPFTIQIAGEESLPFEIPGSAMNTYQQLHKIPDPFWRDNEYQVKDFLNQDFEISGQFEISASEYEEDEIELMFGRVDTIADIFVNDRLLGHVENMHREYCFSCKEFVTPGKNKIVIKIKSATAYVEEQANARERKITMINTGTMPHSQYIRKPHCMFGWDWGPQLPDAGIYEKIKLNCYHHTKLGETLVRQQHENNKVVLLLQTQIISREKTQEKVSYQLTDPEGNTIYEGSANAIEIENPKLWWPRGYGKQPLYLLKVTLERRDRNGNADNEVKEYKIGLRTLIISREKDEWGNEFCFMINGKKIFAMGADYIPDDCVLSNITRETLERDVKAAVYANFNCLRVWGGGFYPTDDFYDLCDQYGILVWQDLMFACNVYDVDSEFAENIVEEAKDNLRRFRNHACLGLISGNNEMELAWLEWENTKDQAPSLKKDYLIQFEYLLKNAVEETAPDTFYWPSSPSSGGSFDNPGDENRGDSHYWEVWHGQKPFSEYKKHYFRFCSEFGFQSLLSMKTIETFTKLEDRNLFSEVMESHQKNPAANGKILYYLSETFKYPNSMEGLSFLSQILQGYAMKAGVEHWRRNRGRCMGSVYWQFNDNWPVLSWSSMDYFGRFKALHYMARRFYAQVAGSISVKDSGCEFWILNESLENISVQTKMYLKDLDFSILDEKEVTVECDALSSNLVSEMDYSNWLKERKNDVFVEFVYSYEKNGGIITKREFELFVPVKHLNLKNPEIKVQKMEKGELLVTAKSFVPYCMLEIEPEKVLLEDNVFPITEAEGVIIKPYNEEMQHTDYKVTKIYDVYHTYEDISTSVKGTK